MTRKRAAAWGREDWVAFASNVLKEGGPEALTVEALCQASGRTRGSLYHHFTDHFELLASIFDRWEERTTEAVIRDVRADGSAGTRTFHLNELALALDAEMENQIRRLAHRHPELEERLEAVDRRRMRFIAELRRAEGLSTRDARALAEIEYAAYLGFQQMRDLISVGRARRLYGVLQAWVTGAPDPIED